jgi:hypothetical protein
MTRNAILYQAYGGTDFVNECRYALLKYLQVYNLKPPANTGIFIYTDQPNLFADFGPFFHQLSLLPLTAQTVKEWRGPHNFVHRVKIKMMIDFLNRFDGNLLYCDTDTYAKAPIEDIFASLQENRFVMHTYEGVIDKTRSPSFHKWEKFLSATPISYNGKQLQFSKDIQMFNAGVIGLPAASKDVLADVLALTDSVYEKFPKHIAEQFAFSYCLQQRGTIRAADDAIAHYWDLKEFRRLLSLFFERNMEESIPELVKKVHHLDALTIMHEKTNHKQLPLLQQWWKDLSGTGWRIAQYTKKL